MKKLLTPLFAFSLLFISSCNKDDGSSTRSCDVSTDPYSMTEDGTVTYTVSTDGTATVSSVSYQGASGIVNVSNPGSSFTKQESLANGAQVSLNAKGTTQGGTITVTYNVVYPDGNAENSQSCGN